MLRRLMSLAVVLAIAVSGVVFAQSQQKRLQEKSSQANAGSSTAVAAAPISKAFLNGYNVPASGVAIDGYCPVCYLAAGKAAPGDPRIAAEYKGLTYYFVSEPVKQTFLKNPEKYLPAFGGWCAVGLANDKNFPVDPTNFKVVNGRVLLFLRNKNVDALALWNQGNEKQQLAAADAAWAKR